MATPRKQGTEAGTTGAAIPSPPSPDGRTPTPQEIIGPPSRPGLLGGIPFSESRDAVFDRILEEQRVTNDLLRELRDLLQPFAERFGSKGPGLLPSFVERLRGG